MANGDDKKIKGGKSGYMYTDNLGGKQYYGEEVDEGGGNFSISGSKGQKTLISREAARLKAIQKGWVDSNISQEDYNKKVDQFYAKRNTTAKAYAAGKTDKQSYKLTSANTVTNTSNNNASNGNPGGGGNIATATATGGAGGSVGNINVGGSNAAPASTPTATTTPAPAPATTTGTSSTGSSSTSGGTRGYTGNTPFNQATATATGGAGGSVGNITINTGGSGGPKTPPAAKPNITGANSPLGGGAKGLLSDMIGSGGSLGIRKTQGGDTPGGPAARRGGSTPYQFRGLQNQFQSWGLNHYNNPNNQT